MNRRTLLAITGLAGVSCALAYQIIGSTVDENGLLQEPFYLIPVSYILMLGGFGGLAVSVFIGRQTRI